MSTTKALSFAFVRWSDNLVVHRPVVSLAPAPVAVYRPDEGVRFRVQVPGGPARFVLLSLE